MCPAEIGRVAASALRAEATAAPKPGLVDRENSGAHEDMDYRLFLTSADVLEPYFIKCADIGAACRTLQDAGYIKALRQAGKQAEKAMFAATGGVNTHKGAIFSMGILCGSIGFLEKTGVGTDLAILKECCARTAEALLEGGGTENTHGTWAVQHTGTGGIRKEALTGFDSAFSVGFPALRHAAEEGFSSDAAYIFALLHLMCCAEDSNVAYRGGIDGLHLIQKEAAAILEEEIFSGEDWKPRVKAFNEICVRRNLSPGGSADLLALSVMLYRLHPVPEAFEI